MNHENRILAKPVPKERADELRRLGVPLFYCFNSHQIFVHKYKWHALHPEVKKVATDLFASPDTMEVQ